MDLISRRDAIEVVRKWFDKMKLNGDICVDGIISLPSAQPDIAEKLYLCKCYVTDEEGLQHEVIHTGDIRRITGWEI